MDNNRISVSAYFVNGSMMDVLEEASPNEAIEEYFLPDMRPPVQTFVIEAKTADGKLAKLIITKSGIHATIE